MFDFWLSPFVKIISGLWFEKKVMVCFEFNLFLSKPLFRFSFVSLVEFYFSKSTFINSQIKFSRMDSNGDGPSPSLMDRLFEWFTSEIKIWWSHESFLATRWRLLTCFLFLEIILAYFYIYLGVNCVSKYFLW